jgi:phosphatidylglycerophosphate synthase
VVKAPEIDVGRTGKSVKTFFGWLFFRRISLPLSLRLARTRVRPSWITAFGLGTGITGAVLIAMGDRKLMVVGAVLAMVAKLLDAMDGEVARAKHLDTATGYVLDGLADRLRDTSLIVGAGVGALHLHPSAPGALQWTIAAVVGYLGFFYVSAAAPSHWREIRQPRDLDEKHMFRLNAKLRLGAGDTLAVLVLIAAVCYQPLWIVVAVALTGPFAIALKLRSLLVLQPWAREDGPGSEG